MRWSSAIFFASSLSKSLMTSTTFRHDGRPNFFVLKSCRTHVIMISCRALELSPVWFSLMLSILLGAKPKFLPIWAYFAAFFPIALNTILASSSSPIQSIYSGAKVINPWYSHIRQGKGHTQTWILVSHHLPRLFLPTASAFIIALKHQPHLFFASYLGDFRKPHPQNAIILNNE